ncbi:MAG: SDR family oxidoreductase [Caldisericia bacterium]|nr:SDR family oxidoreductase [Caldisericia bacterium]
MDLGIKNKIAVVTGGSKGLGKAVAFSLAEEGARLGVCARDEKALKDLKREIEESYNTEVFVFPCDLTKRDEILKFKDEIIKFYGTVHLLFINSGGPPPGGFFDFKEKDYLEAINLNLMSTINLTYAFIDYMINQKFGRIVASTSISVKEPLQDIILSNVSRTPVVAFIKSLSREVGKYNITANCVAPGYTLTDRLRKIIENRSKKNGTTFEEELNKITKDIPLGRVGDPEEYADVVTFLLSERASYVTGVTLLIDGGIFRGLM